MNREKMKECVRLLAQLRKRVSIEGSIQAVGMRRSTTGRVLDWTVLVRGTVYQSAIKELIADGYVFYFDTTEDINAMVVHDKWEAKTK